MQVDIQVFDRTPSSHCRQEIKTIPEQLGASYLALAQVTHRFADVFQARMRAGVHVGGVNHDFPCQMSQTINAMPAIAMPITRHRVSRSLMIGAPRKVGDIRADR